MFATVHNNHLPQFIVSDFGLTSTSDRCSVPGLAEEVTVHVATIPLAQQSHSETMCHPGGRGDSNKPLVSTVVPTPASTLCGPPTLFYIPPRSVVTTGFISDGKSYHLHALRFSSSIIKQQDFQKKYLGLLRATRRPSAIRMYDDRWICFIHWAAGQGFDLLSNAAAQIAAFLYSLFDTHGLSPQTIKGYRTCLASVLNRTSKAKVVQNRTVSDVISSKELQRP